MKVLNKEIINGMIYYKMESIKNIYIFLSEIFVPNC